MIYIVHRTFLDCVTLIDTVQKGFYFVLFYIYSSVFCYTHMEIDRSFVMIKAAYV